MRRHLDPTKTLAAITLVALAAIPLTDAAVVATPAVGTLPGQITQHRAGGAAD